jgi:pimeloyl-ACP methyl ester carboxylesterase
MWRDHLEPLARAGYRAIAVDLPGFGEADVAPGEQAPWNDVLETMAALGVDRATLLVTPSAPRSRCAWRWSRRRRCRRWF